MAQRIYQDLVGENGFTDSYIRCSDEIKAAVHLVERAPVPNLRASDTRLPLAQSRVRLCLI